MIILVHLEVLNLKTDKKEANRIFIQSEKAVTNILHKKIGTNDSNCNTHSHILLSFFIQFVKHVLSIHTALLNLFK